MNDRYLSVVDFSTLQHYKNRNPPWIKLYSNLWDNHRFDALQDETKAHFIGLCMLASKCENRIPFEPDWIARRIGSNKTIDFEALFASGLLAQGDSAMLATRKQSARESRGEKRRPPIVPQGGLYTPEFEAFWSAYPRKAGKGAAMKAFKKVDVPIQTLTDAIAAAMRSKDWTKDGGEYIPHPATWLNRRGWEDEFERKPILSSQKVWSIGEYV